MEQADRDMLANHLRLAARHLTEGDQDTAEHVITAVSNILWRDKAQECYNERQRLNRPWHRETVETVEDALQALRIIH